MNQIQVSKGKDIKSILYIYTKGYDEDLQKSTYESYIKWWSTDYFLPIYNQTSFRKRWQMLQMALDFKPLEGAPDGIYISNSKMQKINYWAD